jgi:hypothetical protein
MQNKKQKQRKRRIEHEIQFAYAIPNKGLATGIGNRFGTFTRHALPPFALALAGIALLCDLLQAPP